MKLNYLLAGSLAMIIQPAIASPDYAWLFELHTGLSDSSANISDADVGIGFDFGGSISYHFMENRLGPYFGWNVNVFDADSVAFPDLEAIVYRRISLGISYQDQLSEGSPGFYARAGVTSSHIQLEGDNDDELADSDIEAGLEAMAGLTFELKSNWGLRAGLIYSSLSDNLNQVSGDASADIDTFSATIGWSLAF